MSRPRLPIPTERLEAFCRRWKVTELALFGSVLRDDFGPESDVDVLVTFEEDAPWSLWDIVEAKLELAELLGRKVDLLERPAVEKHHNPFMKRSILENPQTVYVR